ncbi:MAG: 3',5'-cyclic-nucleotide phosphodiesterase [Thermodesulfovibrio sp.]|nr:3',5'-cyclic-nucleotide phosphodiesterase [Thermodesulfovibrio sp.]
MKIKVLGASGSDLPKHNLSSFLLDGTILFDAGGVTSCLSFKAQQRIEHIFITHAHLDHIRDIPFVADNIILSGKLKQINIFSIREVIEDIKSHLLNYKLWPDFTVIPNTQESILKLNIIEEEKTIAVNGYEITAYRMNHTVPSVGYLVEAKGKRFFYTGDTSSAPDTWKKLAEKKLDALIVEISFPDSMKEIALKTGHLTAQLFFEDLKLFNYFPKRIYITHVKPFYKSQIKKDLKNVGQKVKILNGGEVIRI